MGKTPLWRVIADGLRREIGEGRFGPGDRLPSEAELAARFGVNRHTVRHAQKALIADGLIYSRRGAGSFVLAPPTDYPLGRRVRFSENLLAAGRRPDREIQSLTVRGASGDEAALLQMEPGEALCESRGLSLSDGQPLALFHSLFPEARLPGLAAVMAEETSVTRALAVVGVADYTRASTRLQARAADAAQAAQLRIAEGAPLLYTTGLSIDPDGVPVQFGRTWFAGDRVTLTLEAGEI